MNTKINLGDVPSEETVARGRGGKDRREPVFYFNQVSLCHRCDPSKLLAEVGCPDKIELARKASAVKTIDRLIGLYLLGPLCGFPVKVGIATDPIVRLSALQSGSYEDMTLHAVLWSLKYPEIEMAVLNEAKRIGIHERGEWIAASPRSSLEMVLDAAELEGAVLFTSAMYVENTGRALVALDAALAEERRLDRAA